MVAALLAGKASEASVAEMLPNNFLQALLGAPGASAALLKSHLPGLVIERLKGIGLQKLNPKQNIFQTAHRHFRTFAKQREKALSQERIAQVW
jgi:hypothetical protein